MSQVKVFAPETWISHSGAFQDLTKDVGSGDVAWWGPLDSPNVSFESLVVL